MLSSSFKPTGLIATAAGILELANHLKSHEIIAVDTEFIRESTFFPIVEIIQVATESQSWLVDAQIFKRGHSHADPHAFDSGITPLLEVMADPKILKVLHASQGDQECLYTSFGVVAKPSLDTAVAASLCGYGDGIGLGRLMKEALDITLPKGHARTNWSVRPLPSHLLEYAAADVDHLVLLGKKLLGQLEKEGRRAWALELSSKWEDHRLYAPDLLGITHKLGRGGRFDPRGYAVLAALVKWREERVRHLNLPRRWVADDHVLVDLARVQPQDIGHLSSFRGLNKGELRQNGEAILSLIRDVVVDESTAVPRSHVSVPNAEELQVLDLLKCYISLLADRHKIASKHLMTTAKLLPLLRSPGQSSEDLARSGIMSEEAARLIGEEVLALLLGKRSLCIEDGQVRIHKLD